LVPVEALQKAEDGGYTVVVLSADGEKEQRAVQVGLQTAAFAEIRSGLKEGEQVIVGGQVASTGFFGRSAPSQ
jgi:macrolide-specific efflux system membrane fusion protein